MASPTAPTAPPSRSNPLSVKHENASDRLTATALLEANNPPNFASAESLPTKFVTVLAVGRHSTSILWRLNLAFYRVVPALTRKGATFWSQLAMDPLVFAVSR